jgi:hypothetical protein
LLESEEFLTSRFMVTHERLLELLRYDPHTGIFYWRSDGYRRKAGAVAGRATTSYPYKGRSGSTIPYWAICVDGQQFFRAKLAWYYVTGEYPECQIDHRDTDSMND